MSRPGGDSTAGGAPNESKPGTPPKRRRKTPTVLQMEAVECGAASLCMILGYHGRIVPLEECRAECGVSRDGSKASNVLKAARKYGLEAKGFKYELEDLFGLEYPCILFWNANHFVVLEGFRGEKVYLNDPAQGPRVISMEELDASFSGVVLTFAKGPDFKPGGEKPSLAGALRRRLIGSEAALSFVLLCGLFLVVPGLVIPTFSRIFVDEFLVAGRATIVKPLLVGMAVTLVLQGFLTWLQQHFLLRLETKLALQTSSNFFNHILRLPVGYFAQRFAGEIGSRVAINDKVASVVSGKLATTAIDCFMIVFYAALMARYSVGLTATVIGVALLNVVAIRVVARVRIDASRRLMADKGKLQGTAMNGLKMIETLKATGGETEYFSRWAGYQAKALRAEQHLRTLSDMTSVVPIFVGTLVTGTVLLMGGLRVMDGELTVGLLVAYQALTGGFTKPLGSLVNFGSTLQELEADLNRLDDVLRYPQDPLYTQDERADTGDQRLKLSGRIELTDVTFGYSPLEKPLIENFNLSIQPGQRIALVGGSGSGKSTAAKLISGLYRPWSGEVRFDGVPRDQLPRRLLSNSIGMVDQEIFLFAGTIRENITMWDGTIPAGRVTEAARDGAIAEVIEQRDGGYNGWVGEGGGNFSGGQRQRLEIARSMVGHPTILILDEATSALDPTTEAIVDDALRRRGCTCIIIAHRLSTIRDCDEIVVLQRGKIVQRGTHEEMKDVEGPYADLIRTH
ncbi:MAG: NHLP family bacteriocin export ABC transporter peptidase/permease/ATPase subunit [Thermoanaerobaculia bacterium]|nr:NHLP family bacteriocin export ABC transporter peptidase/permease/ATPase subunit [Thermoanaerobaculia bacterium]MDI9631583.1 NHLP family bacteriocin export ABC transporter peptidase/permease/ATPase subunit [Acidobacteriota bacterium]MBP7813330.1 NHLP family bacteriocin export ABC transporter peptidase/permease/ATPase subunit [Thermoanaerobaculia bacterium]HPA95542.1 NHLP family bacteriocin export ABC transporter peptidase/permease/ATPase subunit [Thermoanaerobaculia bacterium]HRR14093.1 NHLP